MSRLFGILLLFSTVFTGFAQKAPPTTTNPEGQELAAELRAQKPTEKTSVSGVLKVRDAKGKQTEIPFTSEVLPGELSWQVVYRTTATNGQPVIRLTVIHADQQPNRYELTETASGTNGTTNILKLNGDQAMIPFAGTDFWLADLGLEFFQWPEQKLLRKEIKRSRSCRVLASVNPAATNGYVRVLSWIDKETSGIVQAEAYDAQNKLIKTFLPKEFDKATSQLKRMDIRNEKTDSRTILEFDLDNK